MSFFNEWDFCKEFSGKLPVITGYNVDSDSDDDDDGTHSDSYEPTQSNKSLRLKVPHLSSPETLHPHTPPSRSSGPGTPPRSAHTDINLYVSMDVNLEWRRRVLPFIQLIC